MFERHYRRCHRDAALLFNLHPVRPRPSRLAAGLNRTGQVDGAAGKQQLFGQCRFTGVRVGNNRERAAAVVRNRHRLVSKVNEIWPPFT